MPDDLASRFDLGPIDQVGYVVADLDKALPRFEALFGPFRRMDSTTPGTTFRGRRSDVSLRMAFGRSGDIEIELIQPVSGEGSPPGVPRPRRRGCPPRAVPGRGSRGVYRGAHRAIYR